MGGGVERRYGVARWLLPALLSCAVLACGGDNGGDSGPAVQSSSSDTVSASSGGGSGGGGAGTGGALGGGGAGGMAEPDGSWENPFWIDSLPAIVEGSTVGAVSSVADSYFPCAPNTNEAGPEVVYRLIVPAEGWLSARLDDVPADDLDVDIHLLASGSADSCITRDDMWAGAPVQPGEYWLVVDTWVNGSNTALASDYTLEVSLIEEGNNACLESPVNCEPSLPPYVNQDVMEAPGDAGCLPGMARVDTFCVDRYEAMVMAMGDNGWEPVSPYIHPDNSEILLALSVEGALPQGHISQIQAEDACMMAGKRLCSNGEWLRACQGAAATVYPYGNTLEEGRCNDDRACHPVPQYFESSDSWIWSELAHPCISQLPEGLAPTGSYTDCATSELVFDMMGNLHEWTSDPSGTFRGGFYVDTVINGPGCLYATTAHGVSHHDYSTGFRCCSEATGS